MSYDEQELTKLEIDSAQLRDDYLNLLKKYFPRNTVVENTYCKDLLDNKEYIEACYNYQNDVYVFSCFNNINNIWIAEKDDRIFDFIKKIKKNEILYVIPYNLQIIEFYAVKKEQLNYFRKNFKDYSKFKEIYNALEDIENQQIDEENDSEM